jgi:hypothetical protein
MKLTYFEDHVRIVIIAAGKLGTGTSEQCVSQAVYMSFDGTSLLKDSRKRKRRKKE